MARQPKPTVMIFADASWCSETRAGGWGAWIKADGAQSITTGASLKGEIASAHVAELMALANAIHVAKANGFLAESAVVMLQSDCANALANIRRRLPGATNNRARGGCVITPTSRKRKLAPGAAEPLEAIAKIATEHKLHIQVRHVPGHTAGEGRQYVNRLCDGIARRGMKIRRAEMKGGADAHP